MSVAIACSTRDGSQHLVGSAHVEYGVSLAVVSSFAMRQPRRAKNCAGAQEGSRRHAVDPLRHTQDAAGLGQAQPPLNWVGGLVGGFSPGVAPGQVLPIGGEGRGPAGGTLAGQALLQLTGLNIPEVNFVVVAAARGRPPAIRTEDPGEHGVIVPAIGQTLFAGSHVPDTLGVVTALMAACGQQPLAAWAELERTDRATLLRQGAQEASTAPIP